MEDEFMNSWLPDITLIHIFSYLIESDLCRVELVCKQWKEFCFPFRNKLSLYDHRKDISTKKIVPLLKKSSSLKSLDLQSCREIPFLKKLIKHSPYLTELDISNTDFKSVEGLELMQNLRVLKANNLSKFNMEQFKLIGENCQNLTHLDIGRNRKVSFDAIQNILEKCTKLKSLGLQGIFKIKDHEWNKVFDLTTNLQKLNLRHTNLSIDNAATFFDKNFQLHSLDISSLQFYLPM
eukprot:TRINITY_DN10429_c0_g1_i1.p1 TRINITY_DN10429_c0_g1~~TRINITY_DN10429_c0_g1_i1.p1  ORF type:complete len:236 (-),score=42.18 TRINITY_DN10429_c0_g1_i1:23-730(-)